MINYQIVNGHYTFKNKLDKRSVENIILTGLSTRACLIFKTERQDYAKRSTLVLYSMCKHHIPRLSIKTFEKVLGNLLKEKKIFCVYCPQARKYVFGSTEFFKLSIVMSTLDRNKNGFLKNHYKLNDDLELKLDDILREDIERLVS
jgi:hypothetical protein